MKHRKPLARLVAATALTCTLLASHYTNAQTDPSMSAGVCYRPETKDVWELYPDPDNEGQYIFTYLNSEHQCSEEIKGVTVTADDGFSITLYVEIGINSEDQERVTVIPNDSRYMAYPAELVLSDAPEPGEIMIIQGIS